MADSFIIINPHMSPGPSEKRQWYQYAENLLHIVDDVVEKYMGDNKSIYLTGLSRGGSGMGHCKAVSWEICSDCALSGRITCKNGCDKIDEIPLWIIHNISDPTVKFDYSSKNANYLEANFKRNFLRLNSVEVDNSQIKNTSIFSAIEKNGHDAWNEAYASKFLYKWLLDKRK